MSEQPTQTHAARVLPNPHIELAQDSFDVPQEVKDAEVVMLNTELEAMKNGVDQSMLPMGSRVIKAATEAREATTDDMTGLLNRKGMELWFERYAPENMGIVMADARGFKKVNDEYGEDFGDRVIISLARAFESKLRTKQEKIEEERRDTPLKNDVLAVCRWGGDEITAIVNLDSVPENKREEVMELIRQRLENFGTYDDEKTGVSGVELHVRSVSSIVKKSEKKSLKEHIKPLNDRIIEAKKQEKLVS